MPKHPFLAQILLVFSLLPTIKKQFVMLSEQKWTKSKMIFLKSGTLIFVLLGRITADGCFHFGFALPSLWVRSGFAPKSGDKEYSKWDEKAPNHHLSICRKNRTFCPK